MMTSAEDLQDSTCKSIVTQMYTFSSWSKQKNGQSSGSMLSHVGFPGLSLTPIQESPLLGDSILHEDADHRNESDKWLTRNVLEDPCHKPLQPNGSLPVAKNSLRKAGCLSIEENGEMMVDSGGGGVDGDTVLQRTPSPHKASCSVNMHVVRTTTFLPKDEPLTEEGKRAHLCKLLLFALCGFVIVAGIVLWIFSPAFT